MENFSSRPEVQLKAMKKLLQIPEDQLGTALPLPSLAADRCALHLGGLFTFPVGPCPALWWTGGSLELFPCLSCRQRREGMVASHLM